MDRIFRLRQSLEKHKVDKRIILIKQSALLYSITSFVVDHGTITPKSIYRDEDGVALQEYVNECLKQGVLIQKVIDDINDDMRTYITDVFIQLNKDIQRYLSRQNEIKTDRATKKEFDMFKFPAIGRLNDTSSKIKTMLERILNLKNADQYGLPDFSSFLNSSEKLLTECVQIKDDWLIAYEKYDTYIINKKMARNKHIGALSDFSKWAVKIFWPFK